MEGQKQRILRFLGLAQRAGFVESGFDAVVKTIYNNKAKMIIMAQDISGNTLSKFLDVASEVDTRMPEIYRFSDMSELGYAIGKPARALLAVTDDGFRNKLSELLEGLSDEEERG